jgi:hypothetical protein
MSRIKFKEDTNLIQLYEDIYVYKNFLDINILDGYKKRLDSFSENDWHQHGNYEIGDIEGTFWGDKCSLDIIDRKFHDPIFNFFAPNYWMYQHDNFVRLKSEQFSELDYNHSSIGLAEYKVAIYFGDFTGGKVVFPDLKVEYQPESNDLLIFKIDQKYNHKTEPVTSGTRYAYMDYLIKHPGYFMP